MRENILVKQAAVMEEEEKTKMKGLSPRTNRRSRMDRIIRGDINSVEEFRRSFEKEEIGCNQIINLSTEKEGNEDSSNESNVVINVVASTPLYNDKPFFSDKNEELNNNEPTSQLPTISIENVYSQLSLTSKRPSRRMTTGGQLVREFENETGERNRPHSNPLTYSDILRKKGTSSETSSQASTPSSSPVLSRRGIDITGTPAYKELYANNIRSYCTLLYPELNKSRRRSFQDDEMQLHKREKKNTLFSGSKGVRRHSEVPLLTHTLKGINNIAVNSEKDKKSSHRRHTDLEVYSLQKALKQNKGVDKRKTEAEKRNEYRAAKLKSFEELLCKVNKLLVKKEKVMSKSATDLSRINITNTSIKRSADI